MPHDALRPRQQINPNTAVAMTSTTTGGGTPTTTSGGLFPTLFPTQSQGGAPQRSSSLYLFTFLITLVVLAGIIGALVFRSVIIRRRFRRRVAEAIARGERPPERVPGIMGGTRTKPRVKLGPKPEMWEAEMLLKERFTDIDVMRQIEPLSMSFPVQSRDAVPPPPPQDELQQSRARRFANFFQSDSEPNFPVGPSRRPTMPPRNDSLITPPPTTAVDIPPIGTPMTVGVMISFPHRGDTWRDPDEGEEVDLPDVVLGIATVKLQY